MRAFVITLAVLALIAFDVYVIHVATVPLSPEPVREADMAAAEPSPSMGTLFDGIVKGDTTPRAVEKKTGTVPPVSPEVGPSRPPEDLWPIKVQTDRIVDEYVLSFYDDRDRSEFLRIAKGKGIQILDMLPLGRSVRIRVGSKEEFDALMREAPRPVDYDANRIVRAPDAFGSVKARPEANYRAFGNLALPWLGVLGNAQWGKGVTVAVLDTGVEVHPALNERNVIRLSEPAAVSVAEPGGFQSHATAVASIVAGTGQDLLGVSPAAKILSIQVLTGDGSGDSFTLAKGIVDAVDRGAAVINLSLGTRADTFVLRQAIDYAVNRGVAIVAAAGNEAVEGVLYPARYQSVVAVGAVDAAARALFFSNRGPEVDLAAPGLGVAAAGEEGAVAAFSGTSSSAPFVSGAIAALLSLDPDLSAAEAVDILYRYANDTAAPGRDPETGNGVLDLGRAVNRSVSGILDVAVCNPYLHPRKSVEDDILITAFVQNRGTEPLRHVRLKVAVEGTEQVFNFYNLEVGQVASQPLRMSPARVARAGKVQIACTAEIEGGQDINLGDNRIETVLTLRPEPAAP